MSIRALGCFFLSAMLVGCVDIRPPDSLVTKKLSGIQDPAHPGRTVAAQAESDFVTVWKGCADNSCDKERLLETGMSVVDTRCAAYFDKLGRAEQHSEFGSKEWTLLGGTAGAIEGLTSVTAKVISITSTGFGFGASSASAFHDSFLFSADVSSVQSLVASAQSSARNTISDAVKQQPNGAASLNRDDVARVLKQYERTCEVQTIRNLVNQSVNKAKIEADSAPKFTSGAEADFIVNAPGSFSLSASGSPAPTFSKSGPCSPWVQLDSVKGLLSGQPTAPEQSSCQITAQNGVKPDAIQTLSIKVTAAGVGGVGGGAASAPKFTSQSSATASPGQAFSYAIGVTGTPAPTVTKATCPAWINLDAAGLKLTGTPQTSDITQSATCALHATNASGYDDLAVSIKVQGTTPLNLELSFKIQ